MSSAARSVRADWREVANRRTAGVILVCAVLAATLRAPFVRTGISMDEGGYAHIAQQWSRGARLYDSEAWLDRPQGLLLTYRFLLALNDDGWTIRLGAVLAGFAITVLVGLIGWLLAGRVAGIAAAAIYATVGVAPRIEGFTLNGELLASLPATGAVAAALLWHRYRSTGWLVAAGLAAGSALTMKQSGIDGLVVGFAVVVVGVTSWRARVSRLVIFLTAAALPVAASALHGWHLGWQRYWSAMVGYQVAALGRTGGLSARWSDFTRDLDRVGAELVVIGCVASIGLWLLRRSRPVRWPLLAWLLAGAVGINLGGSYWTHYYLQLLPPLAVLAGVTASAVRQARLRGAVVGLAVLPQLLWLAALLPATPTERQQAIPYYGRAVRDERIAALIRAETQPDDRIFVLVSEANLYFLAQRSTDYPYLWGKPIEKIPEALPRLRDMLDGPDRPVLVVLNNRASAVDPTGELCQILNEHYRVSRTIDGVVLLRARNATD